MNQESVLQTLEARRQKRVDEKALIQARIENLSKKVSILEDHINHLTNILNDRKPIPSEK
tara:strand:- start:100 stop:279 length:180 start_codon:yes stop_codon:yes gene_type:complete